MLKLSSLLIGFLFVIQSQAGGIPFGKSEKSHNITAQEYLKLMSNPQNFVPRLYPKDSPDWHPTLDVAQFKYVLVTGSASNDEALYLKHAIAQNLPADMKMVVVVTAGSLKSYQKEYAQYLSSDRIIFATTPSASGGTWARDAFPVPVTHKDGTSSLIGAKYYRPFSGHADIAASIAYSIQQFSFTFVGGNILADENGTCFIVDSFRRFTSTENDYKSAYGCKEVHLMKHVGGLGDIDEMIKPLGNNTILTVTPKYVDQLKTLGYNVIEFPTAATPSYDYRTYANSLVLNGTVFMPTYGISKDVDAQAAYEKLGFKVVGIPSNELSDSYHGSVHCQTMAYPDMNLATFLDQAGLELATH
jgi:agmatine/peptidylarginine deiminase